MVRWYPTNTINSHHFAISILCSLLFSVYLYSV